jgi:hypothetical protein
MMISTCVDRLMALGYEFHTDVEGGGVRVFLPGGLPPPPEAAQLLEYLKAHREELREELRFRARRTERLMGRQMRIEHPVENTLEDILQTEEETAALPAKDELPPEESLEVKLKKAAQLRAKIDKLLQYAEEHILELSEAEKDSINDCYVVYSCALRTLEKQIDDCVPF